MVVLNRFLELAEQLHRNADTLAKSGAEQIADEARMGVPVDTKALYNSIRVEPIEHGHYQVIAGDQDVDYAAVVEYGRGDTSAYPVQPYMTPASEIARPDIIDDARQGLLS